MAEKLISSAARDELTHVLAHYDLGQLTGARRIERGFVNENWALTTAQGRYFLKRRHPDLRDPDIIAAQHALIDHLRSAGFPTPTIRPSAHGSTFLILDGEFYEIQEFISGTPYAHGSTAHFQEAALMLGLYHTYVTGFAPGALCGAGELYSPEILQDNLGILIDAWNLARDPGLTSLTGRLEAHVEELAACFDRHGPLPRLVIHGDYYADNLLFEDNRIAGVVDYDKARHEPRVSEVAEALIYFGSPRRNKLPHLVYPDVLGLSRFECFLRHYCRGALPNGNELNALPSYIRCIWLSVSLQRLAEQGARPRYAPDALRQVLVLGDWARENADRMVQIAKEATSRAKEHHP